MDIRVQGYENQVKLFLVLLVLFLVAAGTVSIRALYGTRASLVAEAESRIIAATRAAQRELGATGQPGPSLTARLAEVARAYSITSLEIVDTEGRVLASTQPWRVGLVDPVAATVGLADPGALGSGGAVIRKLDGGEADAEYGPDRGEALVFVAIDRGAGAPRAILKAGHEILGVSTVTRQIRALAWMQAVAGLVMLAIVLLFVRWVLRPYRALKAAASRLDRDRPVSADQGLDDPDDLISSFTGVIEKLEEQSSELDRMRAAASRGEPGAVTEELLEGLTSGVIIIDAQGRITALNAAGEEILAMTRDDAAGRDFREVFRDAPGLLALLEDGVVAARAHAREVVAYERGAATAHLGVTVSTIPAGPAGGGGVFCLFSDLTEIRGLQERVRVKESLAGLGVLSAGIAHEFRNSLGAILGYAQLIGRPGTTDGAREEHAGAIVREVRSIGRTVDDFLRYARPASLVTTAWDPRAAADEVAQEVSLSLSRPDVSISIEGSWPARIVADEGLVRQALGNLLRNAVEAIPAGGGRVIVTGSVEREGGMLRIEIADSGPGIPDDLLPRLFTPFVTTKEQGTGLGLALAQKAIVSHDGAITAANARRGGACFTIRLPLQTPAQGVETKVETARYD